MITGLLLATVGGIADTSAFFVMQFARHWRWENIWLVWAVSALIVFPWLVVFVLVKDPFSVYVQAPPKDMALALIFGVGWGIGAVFYGMGLVRVGMSLAVGIVVSLCAVNGALIPLLVLHPKKAFSAQGAIICLGLLVVVAGIVLCSIAARRRKEEKPLLAREKASFGLGVLFCVLAGFFSPMLNLAIAFGQGVSETATKLNSATGTWSPREIGEGIVLLAPILSAGFLANAIYCTYLLSRNRTWKDFAKSNTCSHWFFGFLMGAMQMSAFLTYAIATVLIGPMGPVLGWPVYTVMAVLTGNVQGIIRGEWKGSDNRTYLYLFMGILILILSVVVITLSSLVVSANDERPKNEVYQEVTIEITNNKVV